jgi:hypothetical protein
MHPRLIEAATNPTSRTEGDRIVAEEVSGALSAQSGYRRVHRPSQARRE